MTTYPSRLSHIILIESSLVMGMPMSLAKCSCGEKQAFFPNMSKDLGHRSEYDAARAWACPANKIAEKKS